MGSEYIDHLGLSIRQDDRLELVSASEQHPFAGLKLECLGLACYDSILV